MYSEHLKNYRHLLIHIKERHRLNVMQKRYQRAFLAAALIHWLISFFSDKLIFEYRLFAFESLKDILKTGIAWGTKVAFLVLLIFLYQMAGRIYFDYRNNIGKCRMYVKYTAVYFGFMLVFFIVTYPGIWRMDEFGILKQSIQLNPHFWQHYLTTVFYIFSLMLIPVPAGIVFLQIVINSMIVGYIVGKGSELLKIGKWSYLMYLPFVFFPVIDSNLYPMRVSVYAFLELLLAACFVFKKKEGVIPGKKELWILAMLTAVVAVWRTEAIYYLIWSPAIFCIVFYRETDLKKKIKFAVLSLCCTAVLFLPQFLGNKVISGNDYEITAVVLPIVPLAAEAAQNGEEDMIAAVDKVLDTELMLEGYAAGMTGIDMFWGMPDFLKKGYTDAEYDLFQKAYYQLIMKYPAVFLKERWNTFLHSNSLMQDTTVLFETQEVENYIEFRTVYKGNRPLNAELRAGIISFLDCRVFGNYNEKNPFYDIVWNYIPQVIFLFVLLVVLLAKKQLGYAAAAAGVIGKVPLIFITAPSRLFMYYYSVYLIGSVAAVFCFLLQISRYKRRTEYQVSGYRERKQVKLK